MTFHLLLVLAAGLFSTGLFGALSQQSVVMIMMGIELMIGGVVAAADFWHFLSPAAGGGQVVIVGAVVAMAVEMAMGFAVTTALYRARRIDMTDLAGDLKG
ncbi:NADH-quinone oxidoreductase subunit K [Streptomyces sp. NTK 937]|uniref:NADH-quinone oxidoreductase subunit NuoK n=1 Tax=Streptomyces sp. NTK 937 TaxID=1487711 RepID=UPI0004A961A8|nr:NADH-quinone oxidoreductase subunit K [Streptomyces sp. NTK 937]KDQ70044.1 NADH-ubiquinone oxidoreductase [Streptomyces sp. NTK 937]